LPRAPERHHEEKMLSVVQATVCRVRELEDAVQYNRRSCRRLRELVADWGSVLLSEEFQRVVGGEDRPVVVEKALAAMGEAEALMRRCEGKKFWVWLKEELVGDANRASFEDVERKLEQQLEATNLVVSVWSGQRQLQSHSALRHDMLLAMSALRRDMKLATTISPLIFRRRRRRRRPRKEDDERRRRC